MAITVKEVEKIAELSNLTFRPEELERFAHQFQQILEYVAQLESVDTENIPPAYHAVTEEFDQTPLREDEAGASLAEEEALSNAPDPAQAHFRVPRVIE